MFNEIEVTLEQLKEVEKTRVEIMGQAILILYYDKVVYAIADKCPHLGASLLNGTFSNGIVTCYKHSAQIDIKTGEILEKAKLLFIKMPTKHAKTYPTKVEGSKIYIDL